MQKLKLFAKENKLFTSMLILGLLGLIAYQLRIKGIIISLNHIYLSLALLVLNLRMVRNIRNNRTEETWFETNMAYSVWFSLFLVTILLNILTFVRFFQNHI